MRMPNAKQDVLFILSWFRKAFSSPSFKLFSPFIVGFIQLGKEGHTSSMVQSLSRSFLSRSLSSFTRFLGKNAWSMDEVLTTALHKFFHTLKIKCPLRRLSSPGRHDYQETACVNENETRAKRI